MNVVRFSLVIAILAGLAACNRAQNQAAEYANGNPADGNLAAVSESSYQTGQEPAYGSYASEQTVEAPEPPPPLPEYSQPACPGEDYIWTPGYWSYADAGYYWVPGAWVLAPWIGALWTPPWWGYDNGAYILYAGYWGPHIGFYGGIDYGFGYPGRGYYGAYWNQGTVAYNAGVTNVDPSRVHNVYNYRAPGGNHDRVSYNGGRGGVDLRPTAQELAVSRDPRTSALTTQVQQAREASANRAQFAAGGRMRPDTVVADRPLATGYRAPATRPPAEAMRAARTAPETRAPVQANERAGVPVENRTGPGEFRTPEARPPVAERRPAPAPQEYQRVPTAQPRAEATQPLRSEARPEARPPVTERAPARQAPMRSERAVNRPAPAARPFASQARRGPAVAVARPQVRPEPRAAAPSRPAPQARPAPPPRPVAQARPAPEARPAAPPRPAPEEQRKKL